MERNRWRGGVENARGRRGRDEGGASVVVGPPGVPM